MHGMKNYDLIDIVKLLGSIMIIAMHMSAFEDLNPQFQFYGIQLMTRWAVPFFFVSSAFFLYRKSNGEPDSAYTKSYIKRILTLYGVWFLFNLVSIIYKLYKSGFSSLSTWLLFVRNSLTGSVYTAAWYLLASAFGAWIVYVLAKKFSDKVMLSVTFLIYLFCIVTSTYKGLLPSEFTEFLATYMGSTCNHIISGCFYFALGKCIAKHYDKFRKLSLFVCLVGVVVSYLLFLTEIVILNHCDVLGTTDASVFLIPVSLFLFLLTSGANIRIKGSVYFRKMSTIVFCSQGTVNKAACLFAKIIGHPYTYVEFAISCVLMILLGTVIILLQKKYTVFKYLT